MAGMFQTCQSLVSLPDLLLWDYSEAIEKDYFFSKSFNILNQY